MLLDKEKIDSVPEKDVDRTSPEGKASSVQFIHFNFLDNQIGKFKDLNTKVLLGIEHKNYNHMTILSKEIKKSLILDFS